MCYGRRRMESTPGNGRLGEGTKRMILLLLIKFIVVTVLSFTFIQIYARNFQIQIILQFIVYLFIFNF